MRGRSLWTAFVVTLFGLQLSVAQGEEAPLAFAPFETVFSTADQGSVSFLNQELRLETQFIVTNEQDEDAFVEVKFFPRSFASAERGIVVPAHTSASIPLPLPFGDDSVPVPPFLSGWALVRTSQPVNLEEQMTLHNPLPGEELTSSVQVTGYAQPLRRAELPATFDTANPHFASGITIVNPRSVTATLTVELLRQRLEGMDLLAARELVVPPKTRFDFLASELFPDVAVSELRSEECQLRCDAGIVRIRAQEGSDFVAEVIDYATFLRTVGEERFLMMELRPAPSFDLAGLPQRTYQFSPRGWEFPVPLVRMANLRGRSLRLTPFQLELDADDLGLPNIVPVSSGTNLLVDEAAGIAVATGRGREQVVFLEEEGLLFRVVLEGFAQMIVDLPQRNAFEIAARYSVDIGLGFVPVYNHVLIDRSTVQILDRFTGVTTGAPPVPPWRR